MPFNVGFNAGPLNLNLGANGLSGGLDLGPVSFNVGPGTRNSGSPSRARAGGAGVYQNRTVIQGPGLDIVFPNTPMVQYAQSVSYSQYNLTHTNYTVHSYQGTPSPNIQVTGQFTTHSKEEHEYVRNVIHHLRVWTKMNYGIGDGDAAGTPPPIVKFSSHGSTMFNRVPVLIMDFQIPFENSTDQITYDGISLPSMVTISCTLGVHVNPAKQKKTFSKRSFTNGSLYNQGFI